MITYKIIEQEKSGNKQNYTVYNVYRQILGIKFWVKSEGQLMGYILISIACSIPSLLLSCGCSDFQTFSFFKVYGILFSFVTLIFTFFTKKDYSSYEKAETYIKNVIRKRAKKHSREIANFSFNKDASNITKTYNSHE